MVAIAGRPGDQLADVPRLRRHGLDMRPERLASSPMCSAMPLETARRWW